MKTLSLALLFLGNFSINAVPHFSGLINDGKLHLTTLTDSCNHYRAGIFVTEGCTEDSKQDSSEQVCKINFGYTSTRIGCRDRNLYPKTFSFDLLEEGISPEVSQIMVNSRSKEIEVSTEEMDKSKTSAFTSSRTLYVTTLVDTCNSHRAGLKVSPGCKDDRLTRNWASSCAVELMISSTRAFCGDMKSVPHTFTIDLNRANVAREAKRLYLKNGLDEIVVPVK